MSGIQICVKKMSFPEDCIQNIVGIDNWWIPDESYQISRGSLIEAFVPHVDVMPYTITMDGRKEDDKHDSAKATIGPLKVGSASRKTRLPVAAMPLHNGEVYAVYKAKKRPCLVISDEPMLVDNRLTRGKANSSTCPTYLIVPFYGVEMGEKRAGFKDEFVTRVRRCIYPQFHWDFLPHQRGCESIMRLDQMQPIGTHHHAYKHLGYKLSDDAIETIDTQLDWMLSGGLIQESNFNICRNMLADVFG